ncbi:hypothetical protein [Celeribacter sp.]|uniref:DUF4760 domain-containing protein n=1 Tax=Celeribacter sp. TaxID=1890673 RepID=UPI003A93E39B
MKSLREVQVYVLYSIGAVIVLGIALVNGANFGMALGAAAGSVTALLALQTYHRDAKLRRAEWLYRLYQQFYENDRFDPIRRLLDYKPEDEIKQLARDIEAEDGTVVHEAFVDYLNFFEFIAVQLKYGNLKRDEVFDMFEYYINGLNEHEFVLKYLTDYGYENLTDLVAEAKKRA